MLSDKMSKLKFELEKKGLLQPTSDTSDDYCNSDSIRIITDDVDIVVTECYDANGGFIVSNVENNYGVLNEDMESVIESVDMLVAYG